MAGLARFFIISKALKCVVLFIFTLRLSNESKNLKSAILAKNSLFLDSRGLNQNLHFRFVRIYGKSPKSLSFWQSLV